MAGIGSLGPASTLRARLRETIDEAVEGALAMRGALPPSVRADAEADAGIAASIRDQVFRASALGLAGIALVLPRLRELAGDRGELDAADAEALHAWLVASREAPVLLVLEEADRGVRARMPVTLAQAIGGSEGARPRLRVPTPVLPAEPSMEARPAAQEPEARPAPEEKGRGSLSTTPIPVPAPAPAPVPTPVPAPAPVSVPVSFPVSVSVSVSDPVESGAGAGTGRRSFRSNEVVIREKEEPRFSPPPEPQPKDEDPRAGSAERVLSAAERRAFAMELDNARGPKPARVIDQLYMTRYIPLLAAVSRGEADAFVRGVVDAWRSSFEHSYRESYASMRVTGKRPPMVFDAPEVAAKLGRLNGARVIRLVLVDGMSFELGERAMDRLRGLVSANAVCVERTLLWSALPSTTPQQIALLARGAEGLREDAPPSNGESEIARGRAISTIRRERVGSREVMRLDCVEARLKNAGPPYDERLDAIAEEAAQALARFMEGQQPRTMLFLFGDHGFRIAQTPDGRSTGAATQGGASPEEVLVPGYAWLVGGVH
ncbi:MAG TPA: hypothetical protein VK459_15795 [Polyangiaceae bacterium]|nr:hypothetical protein [Polyangiaceae bacterium]